MQLAALHSCSSFDSVALDICSLRRNLVNDCGPTFLPIAWAAVDISIQQIS